MQTYSSYWCNGEMSAQRIGTYEGTKKVLFSFDVTAHSVLVRLFIHNIPGFNVSIMLLINRTRVTTYISRLIIKKNKDLPPLFGFVLAGYYISFSQVPTTP